jgi:ectoine hydroxylase-related dioxygenase (phytanoyl-CoA dioxygenase family)
VQGVLCLTDTDADMGGFQCIPGFHRGLEEWIATQPADRNPRIPDLTGLTVVPIPAKQGDFIVWDSRLAHGNGHNVSQKPRFSQYISLFPAPANDEETRLHRIDCWRNRLPPGNQIFPGDPREIEQHRYQTAELTPLGRKLLGLDRWETAENP